MRRESPVIIFDLTGEVQILGDSIGLQGDNEAVVQRIQFPYADEVKPQVCTGWWEEQCFDLYVFSGVGEAVALRERYGTDAILKLWESVSRETVQWLRSLDFGFHEEDCLLIHGSTVSYDDELTPETPAIQICDRRFASLSFAQSRFESRSRNLILWAIGVNLYLLCGKSKS